MILQKNGVRYNLKDATHIAAFKNNGWKQEPEQPAAKRGRPPANAPKDEADD